MAAWLAVSLLLASCTGDGDSADEPTTPEVAEATTTPSEEPPVATPPTIGESPQPTQAPTGTASPEETATSATPTPTPARTLPDEWYEDANGNVVPDFVERNLGWDPTVNECVADLDCPGIAGQTLDSLAPVQQSVLVMLDSSGSMAEDVADGQKIDVAKDAIQFYATGTPDTTDLGFMVYGHVGSAAPEDQAASCAGTDVLAPLGEVDYETMPAVLEEFVPTGFTPIAASLQQAEQAFAGREGGDNRVILVSDGLETCDGDPVAAAQALRSSGIAVTVDVIGFDVPDDEAAALQAIAEAGGGEYIEADDGASLRQAMLARLGVAVDQAEGLACVANAVVTVVPCLATVTREATAEIQRLGSEGGPWTPEQEAEISEFVPAVSRWGQEQNRALSEVTTTVVEELRAAREAADERLERQYGETIGLGPLRFCWEGDVL